MTNYDDTDIPAAYDRARDHGPEVLDLWMRAVAAHIDGRKVARILDLGCGTGRFSAGLAAHFDAAVIALDPSWKMLEQAREKVRGARMYCCRARAEALPLASGSIDLVFMSMSFHHFNEARTAARECRRVLRSGGSVVVRTGTREQISSYPYVPFFPSIPPILERMLPSRRELEETFAFVGMEMVACELVAQKIAPDWLGYAEKLAVGADSALARLSREEFQAGIAALRRYGAQGAARPVIETIDLVVLQ